MPMLKNKKIIVFFILILSVAAASVFAKTGLSHSHVDFLPEGSLYHIILMSILLVIIAFSAMTSWNCAVFFGGQTGKGFERIAIGIGIVSVVEILNILNHLGWVITESTLDHFVKIISFIIIASGFQIIMTAKIRGK